MKRRCLQERVIVGCSRPKRGTRHVVAGISLGISADPDVKLLWPISMRTIEMISAHIFGALCLLIAGFGAVDAKAGGTLVSGADWCRPERAHAVAARSLLDFASHHLNEQPNALPHLHTEGTLPHQGIRDESIAAERDWPIMREAALAWRISGDPRYLQQVDTYLLKWAGIYQADFNPIDETNLDGLIQAYAMTRAALQPQTRTAAQAFLRNLGNSYIERIQKGRHSSRDSTINNWQSHRIKLITLVAAALDDRAMLDSAHALFQQQLADNIRPDGSVFDFYQRDALHYVVYDLQPLVQAALAAKPYGVGGDWLHSQTPRGVSLAKALDWLRPYAEGQLSHQEFVHSKVGFDAARQHAGESGFSGQWDPKSSGTLFWLAAQLDRSYLPVAQKLAAQPPDWIGICD
jgi:hypothetical protein